MLGWRFKTTVLSNRQVSKPTIFVYIFKQTKSRWLAGVYQLYWTFSTLINAYGIKLMCA